MDYRNVWGEYVITTKACGIDFLEAYFTWKDMDHVILSKYETLYAYLQTTQALNIPIEEALVAWDIHIRPFMLDNFVF